MDFLTAMKRFPGALAVGLTAFLAGVKRAALGRPTGMTKGDQSRHKTKTLEERNAGLIESHLKKLSAGYHRRYYIENAVRDCIQEIALAERNPSMAPNYAYLSDWSQKATSEYQVLKDSLLNRFRAHHEWLNMIREENQRRDVEKQVENLKTRHADLIRQFYEIAERKVSLLDDYGDENWDALLKEIQTLIEKIAKREGNTEQAIKNWRKSDFWMPDPYRELRSFLNTSFKEYHHNQRRRSSGEASAKMSGTDFERFLVKLLRENGFSDISGTPACGDQGADLIAKRNGRKVIIRAKCYEGAVGNKAVQEVVSAVAFYGGDEGWVMTNSTFTRSAKELAQKTGIKLFDGRDLARFAKYGM